MVVISPGNDSWLGYDMYSVTTYSGKQQNYDVPMTELQHITESFTIPSEWYRSQQHFLSTLDAVFCPSWQPLMYVPTMPQAPHSMHAVPATLLPGSINEPLLAIRTADDVAVYSNVCTHRGTILTSHAKQCSVLSCRYHGRKFSSNGKCIGMPEFTGVVGFPAERDNLPKIASGSFLDVVYVSLRTPTMPLELWLAPVLERCPWLHDAPIERLTSHQFSLAAHWALYVENYLEGFHIPFVHPELNKALDYATYTTETFGHGVLQRGYEPDGTTVGAWYFWLFPNVMVNVYAWGVSLNVVVPGTTNSTTIQYYTIVLDSSKLDQGPGKNLDAVEMEDQEIVLEVQRGIQSQLYSQGRYSPTKEQGVWWFHHLLRSHMPHCDLLGRGL
jgi:choline monooxygenase